MIPFLTILSGCGLIVAIVWAISQIGNESTKHKSLNDVWAADKTKDNRSKIYPQRDKGDWKERIWSGRK